MKFYMFSKTFLSLVAITCMTLCNNSNAVIDINIDRNICHISCNGELTTFNSSVEPIDKVNNLIGNYFNIVSITYDNALQKICFELLPVEPSIPCTLTITNINNLIFPSIELEGGGNKFNTTINMSKFRPFIIRNIFPRKVVIRPEDLYYDLNSTLDDNPNNSILDYSSNNSILDYSSDNYILDYSSDNSIN